MLMAGDGLAVLGTSWRDYKAMKSKCIVEIVARYGNSNT